MKTKNKSVPDAVLFDLDGTLVDTAPDMATALNTLLKNRDKPPLDFDLIRGYVSRGSRALVELGFRDESNQETLNELREEFLRIYSTMLCSQTTLFSGMPELLAFLENQNIIWGVVTNKPGWLAEPLLELLNIAHRAACVVSSDTVAKRKPDPEPLLHASVLIQTPVHNCVYVGDDPRDVQAGKAAGMPTIVALYGYIHDSEDPFAWNADGYIRRPMELKDQLIA